MGSLMAGWDSPVLGSEKAILQRKKSFTQSEIDSYWKAKRELEQQQRGDATKLHMQKKTETGRDVVPFDAAAVSVEDKIERLSSYRDWWTKSTWAFLNELHALEGPNQKYAAQYHVALKPTEMSRT